MAKQDIPEIQTQSRDKVGTRYSQRLRKEGQLPVVVYGHKKEPLHVSVDAREFTNILQRGAHLLKAKVGDQSESVLVKAVQWDYLGTNVVHVDFARVNLSEKVEVELGIELIGEPKALQEDGAILAHPLTSVMVSCRADSIPEKLTHNIEELSLEGSITLGDIQLPGGVELASSVDPQEMVAQITIVQEAPEEEEAAEGAQPEVIGKSDDESEAEEKSE